MSAKILEFQEGFPVMRPKYFEAYSDEEMRGMNQSQLKEQLKIEEKRYREIQDQISARLNNIEVFQGPSDSKINLDAEDIRKLKEEADLRAENIVKLCSRLGIEKIDLRTKSENSVDRKAA